MLDSDRGARVSAQVCFSSVHGRVLRSVGADVGRGVYLVGVFKRMCNWAC